MIVIEALMQVFSSLVSWFFSFLPVVTLETLFEFGGFDADFFQVLSFLNWVIPVNEMVMIFDLFALAIAAFNVFALVFNNVVPKVG